MTVILVLVGHDGRSLSRCPRQVARGPLALRCGSLLPVKSPVRFVVVINLSLFHVMMYLAVYFVDFPVHFHHWKLFVVYLTMHSKNVFGQYSIYKKERAKKYIAFHEGVDRIFKTRYENWWMEADSAFSVLTAATHDSATSNSSRRRPSSDTWPSITDNYSAFS